jgi:hypothetical protein
MDLDDFKARWQAQTARLEDSLRLNREAVRGVRLARVEAGFGRLRRQLLAELVVNGVAPVLLGAYAAEHLARPRLLAAAALLGVAAVALLAREARALVVLGGLELDGPIAATQARLEQVRVLRLRTVRWTVLLAPLLWVPLAMVGADALWGVDLASAAGRPWLEANLAFGLGVLGGGQLLLARLGARLSARPALQRLAALLTGRTLAAAVEAAEAVARFEREEA